MTIRNLDLLFNPRSVAVIGASNRAGSLGAVLTRKLLEGGLDGPIMPVNPKYTHIQSIPAYPDIAALPAAPDLAVIATPPDTVPGLIAELGAAGTRAAIVITAGFSDGKGATLKKAMLDAARPHLLRIVGPNCLGVLAPPAGLNASFGHIAPGKGHLAFVTQSGAILTSIIDWAAERELGFSHLVSLGDMSDVDFGDMLDYLANDANTHAILLYVEAITQPRKFMSAARAAARSKPVIVVKAGRFAESAAAATSHTGALAGTDAVYDAAFRRAGMLRVYELSELFDAAETLGRTAHPGGDRLTILTNGGGLGVMATDALMEQGGQLAVLPDEAIRELNAVLPATWSGANPVDIIGDAPQARYAKALEILLESDHQDAILVLNAPTAIASSLDAARAVVETMRAAPGAAASKEPHRPVISGHHAPTILTSWVGGARARDAARLFADNGVPTFSTPAAAVRGFMHLATWRRNQILLLETPPSLPEEFDPDTAAARAQVADLLAHGAEWLDAIAAKRLLATYDIPIAVTLAAATPAEAAAAASRLGGPVALKILSPDITHKTDVGGVRLNLADPVAVEAAAADMQAHIAATVPEARLDGFMVEQMIARPGAYELIAGMTTDRQFGPVILFGQGGTAVEVSDDKTLALPPLNLRLARSMIEQTRIYRQLRGFRGLPAVDIDAIALTLIKLAQLIADVPEIQEIDINPLLADADGVVALDARVRLAPVPAAASATGGTPGSADRLAIRPYPKELEEEITAGDETFLLRPIVPEDEPALQAAFTRLTQEEVRFRFTVPRKSLPYVDAARFTQIDYDREMAFVLTQRGVRAGGEIFGVARLHADPDNECAEYAIIVRKEFTGRGLGVLLMNRLVAYARARGTAEIFGYVLGDNHRMLDICAEIGFSRTTLPDDPAVFRVSLSLRDRAAGRAG